MEEIWNVLIVGSGPAGYTAALYTSRANLSPLVIEGWMWGGLLQQTTDVENYPGFPEGIMGPKLMQHFRDQAERFGTRFISELATRIEPGADGAPHTVWVDDDAYQGRTVILAMGAEHKKLGVPGEEELSGLGVSYCATCDAAFFKDRGTIIAGGGDSAMEEAISCRSSPPRSRSCTGALSFGHPRSCSSARASRPTSSGLRRTSSRRSRHARTATRSGRRGCATWRAARTGCCRWTARSSRSATSRSRRSCRASSSWMTRATSSRSASRRARTAGPLRGRRPRRPHVPAGHHGRRLGLPGRARR